MTKTVDERALSLDPRFFPVWFRRLLRRKKRSDKHTQINRQNGDGPQTAHIFFQSAQLDREERLDR